MQDKPSAVAGVKADRGRRRWHFAGAVLDERTLQLLVQGADAELERKPLEVLIYLLERAGEVCTKDELLAGVWPGRILSETVLTKCIGRIREALGDRDQETIKTAYGFGYRFTSSVQLELAAAPQTTPLDLHPGDHPPGRPLWSLVEPLGRGGYGEVWRARHDKTHEERVFKFALDEASLGTLKREITAFRILNDSLRGGGPIVRLLDWNLEQMPYFTEAEYIGGGSLVGWAKNRGGLASIPLPERIEVVERVATALAAVHSVGMLHKDLRPSTIFVKSVAGQAVEIALGGFGSAAVLDAGHVDRLGITRLGFTDPIISGRDTSSLYRAPETMDGAPFTVKSDNYALGVILYQILNLDFHKPLPPEWKDHIEDELLREDLALVVEDNPTLRLADAGVLAQRLRTLDERRRQLESQREAQARTAGSQSRVERSRARSAGIALTLAALVIGLATSTGLYFKARRAADSNRAAAAQAEAAAEFLTSEVLAQRVTDTNPAVLTPEGNGTAQGGTATNPEVLVQGGVGADREKLARVGGEIDARFAAQPGVAAELHYLVGRSYARMHDYSSSIPHLNRAIELAQTLDGGGAAPALRSAAELIQIDEVQGHLEDTLPRYEVLLAAAQGHVVPGDSALLELERQVALGRHRLRE
jgi:DNA-binding winged helix-turn-helix (wHTH) protein/serine/threonine protein kinase